jgi:hypothetical protein
MLDDGDRGNGCRLEKIARVAAQVTCCNLFYLGSPRFLLVTRLGGIVEEIETVQANLAEPCHVPNPAKNCARFALY